MSTSGASRRERIRGSSALFDAVDVVFDVAAAKDGAISIEQTKGREAKDYLHLSARLVDTPSGDIRLELANPTVGIVSAQVLDQAVLAAVVQRPGCSMATLLPVVQGRKEDVSATIHSLVNRGLLVNRGSKRSFRLHIAAPIPARHPGTYPNGGSLSGSPKGMGTAEPVNGSVPGTTGNHGSHGNHGSQYDA